MKILKFFSILSLMVLALASCGKKSGIDPQYFPFKESESDAWGMISPEGKVLFSDEFEASPTIALNDRFFVRNDEGFWIMYTAEAKPEKVGGPYEQLVISDAEVFAVLKKGSRKIDFIDKTGEVKYSLSKLSGKTVETFNGFCDGVGVVGVKGDLYGAINTKGEVVIEPKYCVLISYGDGKLLAIDKKYKDTLMEDGIDKCKISIINGRGEELCTFAGSKFAPDCTITDGLMGISKEGECGIIDMKGEYVVRPSKKFHDIHEIRNGMFIYYDGKKYGLKTIDGDNVLRTRYERLKFAADNLLVANDGDEAFLIDTEDNRVGDETFKACYHTFRKSLIVKIEDNLYGFMNHDGKFIKGTPEMYDYNTPFGDGIIRIPAEEEEVVEEYDDGYVEEYAYDSDVVASDSTAW